MFRFLKCAFLCSALVMSSLSAKDIKMAKKIENTIIKLSRAQNKPPEKMVEYCKQIRREIEKKFYFRFYIKEYLDWAFDLIENECGKVFSEEDRIYFKTIFKVESDSLYENIFEKHKNPYEELYEKSIGLNKDAKAPSSEAVLGVSIVLSGLYLLSTSDPLYSFWGEKMVSTGVAFCKESFPLTEEQNVL